MNTTETDTPRTDHESKMQAFRGVDALYIHADFCRQLEREVIQLQRLVFDILKMAKPNPGLQPGSQNHMRFTIKLTGAEIADLQDRVYKP